MSAVEVAADGARGLPCSFVSLSQRILLDGTTMVLTLQLSYCHGFFIGDKAFLCCLSDGSRMFRGDAAEEPESHIRGL